MGVSCKELNGYPGAIAIVHEIQAAVPRHHMSIFHLVASIPFPNASEKLGGHIIHTM